VSKSITKAYLAELEAKAAAYDKLIAEQVAVKAPEPEPERKGRHKHQEQTEVG
jgi:hypothetical protein